MSDVLSPFTISSPPPPSSTNNNNNNSSTYMLYYGLVIAGIAAIVLAIYNIFIIRRCNRRHHTESQPTERGLIESRNFESNPQRILLSSFKYKKEEARKEKEEEGYECPVCLSVYEEGEEVKKLPRCKHAFHAVCIDMWLHSHFDCPICRTPVGVFYRHAFPAGNSRDAVMEFGAIDSV